MSSFLAPLYRFLVYICTILCSRPLSVVLTPPTESESLLYLLLIISLLIFFCCSYIFTTGPFVTILSRSYPTDWDYIFTTRSNLSIIVCISTTRQRTTIDIATGYTCSSRRENTALTCYCPNESSDSLDLMAFHDSQLGKSKSSNGLQHSPSSRMQPKRICKMFHLASDAGESLCKYISSHAFCRAIY